MNQGASWEQAILKSYLRAGGCADNSWIYKTVGEFIELTAEHKRATVHGGRAAYEHEVRSYIANLKQRGYLKQINRGRYCLTDSGKTNISN